MSVPAVKAIASMVSGRMRRHSRVGTRATSTIAQSQRPGTSGRAAASTRMSGGEHCDEHPVPPDPPRRGRLGGRRVPQRADGARHALMIGAHSPRLAWCGRATGARRAPDDDLGDGEVDDPPGSHQHGVHRLAGRPEEEGPRQEGEHLRAGARARWRRRGSSRRCACATSPRRIATKAITMPAAIAVPNPSRITYSAGPAEGGSS